MAKWRYKNPAVAFNSVLSALERDSDTSHRVAIRGILEGGPLELSREYRDKLQAGLVPADYSLIRLECLSFLRNLIRHQSSEVPFARIGLGAVSFVGRSTQTGRVDLTFEGGTPRDHIILQFVLFVREASLFGLRLCADPECARVFVKTHRQRFCSVRCQKRIQARKLRLKAREADREAQRAKFRQVRGTRA